MNTLTLSLSLALALSLGAVVYLLVSLKKAKKAPVPTSDARDLLHSLTAGGAVVRITVLDPEALMLRRPNR